MPSKTKSSKPGGITAIAVCNYKSICQEQRIELKPLTLLAGANSSGKSSIMQPLLLLKQTLEAPFDPGALLLDGPNVRCTSTEQLFCKVDSLCSDTFSVRFEFGNNDGLGLKFKRSRHPGVAIEITEMSSIGDGNEQRIHLGMTSDEIEQILPDHIKSWKNRIALSQNNVSKESEFKWAVIRDRCFLSFNLGLSGKQPNKFLLAGITSAELVGPNLENIIHVPGLRGNPARTYRTTAVGKNFPGTFENYCASIINHWQSAKDDRLKQLGSALETLGLTWKVEAKPVDDTQVELRVGRLPHSRRGGARDLVSIADVGFGVSQTLPILVALLTARAGQIVYLEQPEIHLHPKAQKQMAKLLAEAASRGVVVIVETHSSLLLRGIQTLVARGELSHDLVNLNWFTRKEGTGATVVDSSGMDEQGAFGQWPEDFDDVALEADSEYLDAVERRSACA
ncbi:MAG: AAA family ATPase [Nitrospirae bacterium]|nr:AAA family ATPase [Nitrospirota bacterium]